MPVLDVRYSKPSPIPRALRRWERGGGSADANQHRRLLRRGANAAKNHLAAGRESCWIVFRC